MSDEPIDRDDECSFLDDEGPECEDCDDKEKCRSMRDALKDITAINEILESGYTEAGDKLVFASLCVSRYLVQRDENLVVPIVDEFSIKTFLSFLLTARASLVWSDIKAYVKNRFSPASTLMLVREGEKGKPH